MPGGLDGGVDQWTEALWLISDYDLFSSADDSGSTLTSTHRYHQGWSPLLIPKADKNLHKLHITLDAYCAVWAEREILFECFGIS